MDFAKLTLEDVKRYFDTLSAVSPKTLDYWVDKFFTDLSHYQEAV